MTAFEGNDVRKHRMENVAGCSQLMDRHMLSNFFTKLLTCYVPQETMGTVRRFTFIFKLCSYYIYLSCLRQIM
jgi:hypothetical protein